MDLLTPHARARMQQPGIRPDDLEALLEYGSERYTHHLGCEILFWDKKARTRLVKRNPSAARAAARVPSTYAVLGASGVVITVGHRYRRIFR